MGEAVASGEALALAHATRAASERMRFRFLAPPRRVQNRLIGRVGGLNKEEAQTGLQTELRRLTDGYMLWAI